MKPQKLLLVLICVNISLPYVCVNAGQLGSLPEPKVLLESGNVSISSNNASASVKSSTHLDTLNKSSGSFWARCGNLQPSTSEQDNQSKKTCDESNDYWCFHFVSVFLFVFLYGLLMHEATLILWSAGPYKHSQALQGEAKNG